MKVNRLTEALRLFTPLVRNKRESQEDSNESGQGSSGKDRQKDQKREELLVTDEKIAEAVETFASDVQSQRSGLSAAMQGKGPGLKVILKDGTGAVIRQFTGEEFLRLRQDVARDQNGRGKILDQKA